MATYVVTNNGYHMAALLRKRYMRSQLIGPAFEGLEVLLPRQRGAIFEYCALAAAHGAVRVWAGITLPPQCRAHFGLQGRSWELPDQRLKLFMLE